MTPQEFGTWLEARVRHNDEIWYLGEDNYGCWSESINILEIWKNVDLEAHWLPSPASTEGTQHSASSQTQRKTRSQDVTLPELESPETT